MLVSSIFSFSKDVFGHFIDRTFHLVKNYWVAFKPFEKGSVSYFAWQRVINYFLSVCNFLTTINFRVCRFTVPQPAPTETVTCNSEEEALMVDGKLLCQTKILDCPSGQVLLKTETGKTVCGFDVPVQRKKCLCFFIVSLVYCQYIATTALSVVLFRHSPEINAILNLKIQKFQPFFIQWLMVI